MATIKCKASRHHHNINSDDNKYFLQLSFGALNLLFLVDNSVAGEDFIGLDWRTKCSDHILDIMHRKNEQDSMNG